MRKKLFSIAAAAALLVAVAAVQVSAHHSFAAEFDAKRPVKLRGTVVKMEWINPHSWVHFEVTMQDGSKVVWAAETPPPNQLIRQGWRRSDLGPEDEILVQGYAAKNGTRRVWARNVAIVAHDGKELAEPRTVLALFDPNPDGVPPGLLPGRD